VEIAVAPLVSMRGRVRRSLNPSISTLRRRDCAAIRSSSSSHACTESASGGVSGGSGDRCPGDMTDGRGGGKGDVGDAKKDLRAGAERTVGLSALPPTFAGISTTVRQ